jgi:hypothetical protein
VPCIFSGLASVIAALAASFSGTRSVGAVRLADVLAAMIAPPALPSLDRHECLRRPRVVRVLVQAHPAERA